MYSWVGPLLQRGDNRLTNEELLDESDLLRLPSFEDPTVNANTLRPYWEEELANHPDDPKLGRALRRAFGLRVLVGGLFRLVSDGSAFAAPFLLQQLIRWLSNKDAEAWEGIVWALALTLSGLIMSICLNNATHHTMTGFQRMATALMVMVYDAALEHPAQNDTGKLTSAHMMDTSKFIEMSIFVHGLWVSPILVIAAIVALYFFIGYAGLAAVGLMIIFIPVQGVFMGFIATHMRARLGFAKTTIGAVNEALQGIRICKFMNWETSFAARIAESRAKEVGALKETYFYRSVSQVVMNSIPFVILFILFLIAERLGQEIKPDTVFPTLAMITVIRIPLMFIPMSIAKMFELQFSIDRIQSVILGGRKDPVVKRTEELEGGSVMLVRNATVLKSDKDKLMTFDEVTIPAGKLTAIVGPTGSGKSTLVLTLLGETELAEGAVIERFGSAAYVPQEPWLMNATVQRNVTMGTALDDERYAAALEACQLATDMDQLPAGDATEVGERGITLSGGQKQRISLARAAYSGREIIVMDDPLSAVDPNVRRGLFYDCICGLMEKQTRVLVTHQTQFLPKADKIVHIDADHKVDFMGTYEEYLEAGFAVEAEHADSQSASPSSTKAASPKAASPATEREKKKQVEAGAKLMTDEENRMGEVAWSVYGWYLRLGGVGWWVAILLGLIFWRASTVMIDLWLAFWAGRKGAFGKDSYTDGEYMLWYGVTILISIVFIAIRMEFFRRAMLQVAEGAHATLTASLLHAPVSFYDTTPMGRILNRFNKDMDVVDVKIPETLLMVLMFAFLIFGMLVLVALSTPYILIAFPILAAAYRYMYRYYARTIRGLKRLEGSARSPFMAMMNETIGGLATIRAYNCVEQFSEEHRNRAAAAAHPVYCTRSCQRWLSARSELVGLSIIFLTSMLAVMSHALGEQSWNTDSDASLAALAITYAMATTNTVTWITRMMAELESDMSSTERIKDYVDNIPQERIVEYSDSNPKPAESWPTSGRIEFKDVSLRYRDELPLVLKGLSFVAEGGQKIGVVGRTGSGKSTVMLALFRMVEVASGTILLDGRDVSTLALPDLRTNITIIPQDPLLFAGTVRSNLDPFDNYTDDEIWAILAKVGLKKRVEEGSMKSQQEAKEKEKKKDNSEKKAAATPASATNGKDTNFSSAEPIAAGEAEPLMKPCLSAPVAEKGSNFSVGERQLMCLARALLKKSRILLLDEATASVDYEADAMIQETIRTEFAECTVLTIAHRLATVVDSDRILVLDEGVLAEFESPSTLLANEESTFYSMAQALGDVQFAQLVKNAK